MFVQQEKYFIGMAEKIKVIWLVNVLFPEVCNKLGVESPVIGGWLYSYKKVLDKYCSNISLYVISPYLGHDFVKTEINGVNYFVFPENGNKDKIRNFFVNINETVNPDIVHIHGSEYRHSLMFAQICDTRKVVLSIQGMTSVYANYMFSGLERRKLFKAFSIRDFLKRETVTCQYKKFVESGKNEIELIKSIGNIIGRTSWDRANSLAINENLKYYRCEEPLRDAFYRHKWNILKCERYSIFLSQMHYSIKGFHVFLKALFLIKRIFPQVIVYVAGDNNTLKPWYKITVYWKYIKKEIERLNLTSNIRFMGRLSEENMVKQYLKANVFVCPSSIENSSNSVCEAQLLGTPIVASYVGGMMDLINDEETGLLYRFEEHSMMAEKVCRIFSDTDLALKLSENGKRVAEIRHNHKFISVSLNSIYNDIINNNEKR